MSSDRHDRPHELDQIVADLQKGVDFEENFRLLFDRFYRPVYWYFSRRGLSGDEGLDLTQEAFFRVYKSIGSFRGESSFEGWLFGIVANIHRNYLRSQETSKRSAVFQLLRAEETAWESLDALIDLRMAFDLDAGQIGRLFGVPESTVREWEEGQEAIPSKVVAKLSEVQDSLQRLRSMFLSERLPQVVRRPAKVFDGDSALDWILQGRIREVTDRYDFLLRYQA